MIVVLRAGAALGDFVATLPVLHRLAEHGDVRLYTNPRYAALLWDQRSIKVVDGESPHVAELFAERVDLSHVELAVAWTPRGAEALRACGAREVWEGPTRPSPGVAVHDALWEPLVPRFGPRDRDPRLRVHPDAAAAMDQAIGSRRPVVVSPGSGGAAKRRPIAWWHEATKDVDDVIWAPGPVEQERDEPTLWPAPLSRVWDLDLTEMVALAARCRAWVCPDSGPGHVAAAAGARVGVVFTGVTDPACWAPPGSVVFGPESHPHDVRAWLAAL